VKKINSQSGNAHIVVIVVLVVALVATLGFVYWQNLIHKPVVADENKTTGQTAQTDSTSTSNSKMIDYRTNGDSTGIKLLSSSDVDKLTGAPQSFKDFIGPLVDTAIKSSGSPVVDRIYDQKYAVGGGFTDAYLLWGNVDGSWMQIAGTQNIGYECVTLEKYKVPSAIAGTTCLDGTENGRAYSQS